MKIKPDVDVVYDEFPDDFVNKLNGWGFSRDVVEENKGKLLTLDIDFGDHCSLDCPHCFRKENKADIGENKSMGFDDTLKYIKEAKSLGLRSVKFLGAGEPFENTRFLEFLRELRRLDLDILVFTKGHVIGDDEEVKKWNSDISTGEELVEELKKLNIEIMLGFNSFDTEVQDKMVGDIKGHSLKRNRALELFAKAGFNKHNPTHLCLAANPVTNENYDEIFEIYKWGRERNLYVIVCPTMISGRESENWKQITPSNEKLVELYTKIYKFNIEKGLQSIKQIEEEGISPYAGGYPCNQVGCGMYVTLNGKVLRCPGDDITFLGDLTKDSLKDIWENSENFKRAGTFNCGCPPKIGKSIPVSLFRDVMAGLK